MYEIKQKKYRYNIFDLIEYSIQAHIYALHKAFPKIINNNDLWNLTFHLWKKYSKSL